MRKTLGRLLLLTSVYSIQDISAQSTTQGQPSPETAWRARRAADSLCATYPRVSSSTTRGLRVRRDPATGRECEKPSFPTLSAFVLTDHLICPSATPWNDPNPLALLSVARVARIEVKRDSLTFAKWRCSAPVDAVIIVTAKPSNGS
jgi:hypothetical protein